MIEKPANKYKYATYQPFNQNILFYLVNSGYYMSISFNGELSQMSK